MFATDFLGSCIGCGLSAWAGRGKVNSDCNKRSVGTDTPRNLAKDHTNLKAPPLHMGSESMGCEA